MNHLDVLLAARASVSGKAQRKTAVRHVHLARRMLGLVVLQMAHEPFSALGVAMGHGPDEVTFGVVIEPRNPHILFRSLTPFAAQFVEWFESFGATRETTDRKRGAPVVRTLDAPQMLVPNAAHVDVLRRWGRRFTYLRTDGDLPADPALVRFGAHMQFLGEHAYVPGQSLVVAATTLLRRHWVTGQSPLEDENLAALDAWIAPPRGVDGFTEAVRQEFTSSGPLLGPDDENEIFEIISDLNQTRAGRTDQAVCTSLESRLTPAVRPHLEKSWRLMWRTVDREREYPEAAHAPDRWDEDRREFTYHLDWVAGGGRRRAKDSVRRAASLRIRLEEGQARVGAQEGLDDPYIMAGLELEGKAFSGRVVRVDADRREQGPKRMVSRPYVVVEAREPCRMPLGKELTWTDDLRVEATIVDAQPGPTGGSIVTLRVSAGMKALPVAGSEVTWSVLSLRGGPRLPLPKEIPWTHEPPAPPSSPALDGALAPSWEAAS